MTKLYCIVNKEAQKSSDVFSANSDKQAMNMYNHNIKTQEDAEKYTLICLGIYYNEMLEDEEREEKYFIDTTTFPYNVLKKMNHKQQEVL